MRLARLIALLTSAGVIAGAQIRFEEIARKAGVTFELRNSASGQFHQIELMVGGVAAFDFNNDGCTDIYFTNGAAIPSLRKTGPEFYNRLYRNNCDLTFTDVTAAAGVAGEGYAMGVATADFDNDGLADIFVAGVNRNTLYRNLGNGRFADITDRAGLAAIDPKYGKQWAVAAGWFDYDNDGWLDLFVVNYVAWDPVAEAAMQSARESFLLPSERLPRAAQSALSQQPRRHLYRCLPAVWNCAAYREGNGCHLCRFRPRRIHRRICRQRLGAQFSVPQSRRRHVPRNRPGGRRCPARGWRGDCRDGRGLPRFRQRRVAGPDRFRHGERQLPVVSQSRAALPVRGIRAALRDPDGNAHPDGLESGDVRLR